MTKLSDKELAKRKQATEEREKEGLLYELVFREVEDCEKFSGVRLFCDSYYFQSHPDNKVEFKLVIGEKETWIKATLNPYSANQNLRMKILKFIVESCPVVDGKRVVIGR